MEFTKNLSPSEAKYKYVCLTTKIQDKFPEKDKIFKLKFKGKNYDMKVNNRYCIMLSQLYSVYQFKDNDEITITKKDIKNFELVVN